MTAKIIVTIAGLALVIFVNWYFFLSKRKRT
jgi:plastocyanin domain-containing protein